MKKIILLVSIIFLISGCGEEKVENKIDNSVLKVDCEHTYAKVDEGAVLIDVRSEQEYNLDHLDDAINIPVEEIEEKIESVVKDKGTNVILYCRSGNRSNNAAQILLKLGYYKVYDLGAMDNCKI